MSTEDDRFSEAVLRRLAAHYGGSAECDRPTEIVLRIPRTTAPELARDVSAHLVARGIFAMLKEAAKG